MQLWLCYIVSEVDGVTVLSLEKIFRTEERAKAWLLVPPAYGHKQIEYEETED